ncbi:hypothetical protein GCM10010320_59110 [Streptomyces caelestis]|jgi:hypothetical protein|uniref:Uncharacterized protein n=1 Tax=Streptomyces caelestis TaxID=36816 RepID=A0A7W9LQN2_9ACTN|nr:hypothetical protein [Streptomyces caelestis]GGW69960.1 hypothetical protein GCM10010320_59110 [Streptomyces caelestis]
MRGTTTNQAAHLKFVPCPPGCGHGSNTFNHYIHAAGFTGLVPAEAGPDPDGRADLLANWVVARSEAVSS